MRVEIEVVAAPLVNYAMAHNGLGFLHRVTVAFPDSTTSVERVALTASIRDAEGRVLTRPWSHRVDGVAPGGRIALDSPAIRLDPHQMSTAEEEIAAEIVVSVTVGDDEASAPVESFTPIRVLAARQWLVDPHAVLLSLELLAAFVQPNHPGIDPLLPAIGDRLTRATRSGSLAVSDVRPERIDAIVEAVFSTVHDLGISYAEPPAGWGYGQKVRSVSDVLTQQLGTCLDTTLALASVLEHLGIAPVIWIARGHAFLGWWRGSGLGLPDAASLQVATAANAVDLKAMGVLETTLLTRERRPPKDLFRRAAQAPLDGYFRGGTADLVGVVDVAMTRMMRVRPMPVSRLRADGVTEIVEYHAAAAALTSLRPGTPPASATLSPSAAAAPPPRRIQTWKNALLDLTLRNPLLNLGRGMTQLPLLMPHEQLGAFASLLQEGRAVAVRAADDLAWAVAGHETHTAASLPGDVQRSMLLQRSTVFSDLDGAGHKRAMERLRYRARTAKQETGANLLSVTLGRLDWTLDDRELSAPLLIAPVEIKGVISPHRITFDPAGQVTLNLSLMEKLRTAFDFTVPALRELPQRPDGGGVDVEAVIRLMREAIAAAQLPFRVDGEARLAIIAFTGYLLWRDLDEHWQAFVERPLVRHLALSPTEQFGDEDSVVPPDADLDAIAAAAPIPADGSQAEAIAAARDRRSFVLEGPPGTGKSQTITNILADQMAQGRTVLFVAEKGAALDVVRARLEECGLSPFTLDLHDEHARPNQVRERLRAALALRPLPDQDAYRVAAQDATACAAALCDYARRVHEPNPAGLSLYGARGLQLARGEGAALTVGAQAPGAREAVARAVPQLAALGDTSWHAWGFARYAPVDLSDWLTAAATAAAALELPALAAQALAAATTHHELAGVAALLSEAATDGATLREVSGERWQSARIELTQRTESLQRSASELLDAFDPAVITVPLEPVRQSLREAEASFFLGRKRRLLAAGAPLLGHLRPGARSAAKELPALAEQVAGLAAQTRDLVAAWRALPGCAALPPAVNPLAEDGHARIETGVHALEHHAALLAELPAAPARAVTLARSGEPPLPRHVQAELDGVVRRLGDLLAATGSRPADQRRWADGVGLLQRWAQTLPRRTAEGPAASGLRRWAGAVTALAPLDDVADEARWQLLTGAVPAAEAVAALERGLAAASVVERLDHGGFAGFDAERQDATVHRFVQASDALRGTLRSVLPATVVERRPFRPGKVFGTVAALEREVNRSRGGLSVRRLVEQYGPVIAEVTPCVLVSPDSLARFIPPRAMSFDLVVFDEASQITVADAIGALGRADAAVVAGDSQQMPPSMFGQLAAEDDVPEAGADVGTQSSTEEFRVVPDEESILSEAVMAGLPRLWLSWHYRSRDEALISFSNDQYYEGRLLTFPAVPGRGQDSGLSFTRVPGQFHRSARAGGDGLLRTNPVEATAVADEVLRRWRAGERSIGVVTFNVQQRALIESMLIERAEPGVAESLDGGQDGLFVKNLENVQGDERDVVVFSTGFSAAANGVLPLNFGPLNRAGGERRLNVAVTRARRRVMVFSSFEPEDLRAEQTSSVGIRHLRAYLELAKYGTEKTPEDGLTAASWPATVDRHRDEIATHLRAHGVQVRTGLGLSEFQIDLAVGPPGAAPVLAVLLDSPQWAHRRTTGDRDGLAITVLQRTMGWPAVARVWLPHWLADPQAVIEDLLAQAETARTTITRAGERTQSWTSTQFEPAETADPADPVGLERAEPSAAEPFLPYSPALVGVARDLDALAASRRGRQVQDLIRAIVQAEGPIAPARLARHVAHCHGLTRVQGTRQADILRLVPADLRRDAEEHFVWPSGRDPLLWRGYRGYDGPPKERPLEEVAVIEISNALCDLAHRAMGISVEELFKEATRAFGGTRVTEAIRARLGRALDHSVRTERLAVAGSVVMPR